MTDTDRAILFEQFIDLYYPSIFSAIARLTGQSDEKELEIITVKVFVDLWQQNDELFNKMRPPAFIYKILIRHVFSYLKRKGKEDHILMLQKTVLIDPTHYADIFDLKQE